MFSYSLANGAVTSVQTLNKVYDAISAYSLHTPDYIIWEHGEHGNLLLVDNFEASSKARQSREKR